MVEEVPAFKTELTHMLHIKYPIIQAPMAGGITTPDLVAAVSNAGALGNIGAGYLTAEQLQDAIKEVRKRTDKPFGVNLFVPERLEEKEETVVRMIEHLHQYHVKYGIAPNRWAIQSEESFEEQVQVLREEKVAVFSFTFGIPQQNIIEEMKQQGTIIIGTATTVAEARKLEAANVDAIVAQGYEAGGHRGTFLNSVSESLIGTMALVPQIVDHTSIPVIASGGMMDGRGLIASLALGAGAVQMGTAFLTCPESGAHQMYKEKILSSNEDATEITKAYSGKAARGIRTTFMREIQQYDGEIPAYPIQNTLTRDIRQVAAKANDSEYMSLWAGQGLRLAKQQSAEEMVKKTIEQATSVQRKFL